LREAPRPELSAEGADCVGRYTDRGVAKVPCKINQQEIIVNPDPIETIEFSPLAVMSLTTSVKVIVDETPEAIIRKVIEFRSGVNRRNTELRARLTFCSI
jgi:flagellar protein FlbD